MRFSLSGLVGGGGVGAGIGAAIGSVVPGIGTAIGAAVGGGIGGLFGGSSNSHSITDPFGKRADEQKETQQMQDRFSSWQQYASANNPLQNNDYNPAYFNNLANYAQSTSDSPWLQMLKSQLDTQQLQRSGDISAQLASGQANALDQLALRGGYRSGASERLASDSSLANLLARQRLAAETNSNKQAASIEEARMKQGILSQLPGFEAQRAQNNLSNLLDKYRTDMSAFAGGQQANALLASSRPAGLNRFIDTILPF